jgi:hypothetical protein
LIKSGLSSQLFLDMSYIAHDFNHRPLKEIINRNHFNGLPVTYL